MYICLERESEAREKITTTYQKKKKKEKIQKKKRKGRATFSHVPTD